MIERLVRKNIRKLKPYASARSLYTKGLFMDANENAFGSVIKLPGIPELNRYPDPRSLLLRAALARYVRVPNKYIFAGNGSDEVIDLLIRLFVEPDESILIVEPTYGVYKVAADIAGVKTLSAKLDKNFRFDAEKILRAVTPKTKIIFCCSPNNPTGTLISQAGIKRLCSGFSGIVVVDEAYVEFASTPSFAKLVLKTKNLVVLRTLSKVWGLAGLRVGYAIADKRIINYLDKIKAPYNLNSASAALAISALKKKKKMLEFRKAILSEREKLSKVLENLGFAVYPSEANFLLVKYSGADSIFNKLVQKSGIIVRNFGDRKLLKDCLRITVGTPPQNALLIKTLSKII